MTGLFDAMTVFRARHAGAAYWVIERRSIGDGLNPIERAWGEVGTAPSRKAAMMLANAYASRFRLRYAGASAVVLPSPEAPGRRSGQEYPSLDLPPDDNDEHRLTSHDYGIEARFK